MKGLPRYDLNSIAFMCLIGLRVMSFSSLEAQAVISTATQLLAQKEGELNTFVDAVEENSRNCGTCLEFLRSFFLVLCMWKFDITDF